MRGEHEQDRKIAADVSMQLKSRGLRSPCNVVVSSSDGNVTLAGKIQYDHQRHMAMQIARSIPKVRRVIDLMQLLPRADLWKAPKHDAKQAAPNSAALPASSETPPSAPNTDPMAR